MEEDRVNRNYTDRSRNEMLQEKNATIDREITRGSCVQYRLMCRP